MFSPDWLTLYHLSFQCLQLLTHTFNREFSQVHGSISDCKVSTLRPLRVTGVVWTVPFSAVQIVTTCAAFRGCDGCRLYLKGCDIMLWRGFWFCQNTDFWSWQMPSRMSRIACLSITSIDVCLFVCLRKGFSALPWTSWNSLYTPHWPWAQRSTASAS